MTPQAVELAIADVRYYLHHRIVYYDIHFLDAEVALYWCHFRETNRIILASLAEAGWAPAQEILRDMARFLTAIGDPLPLWLQERVVFSAENGGPRRSKRGQSSLNNIVRDLIIAQSTDMVAARHNVRPTRNTTTTTECGCSIVAKALQGIGIHMSEANVAAIWQRERRREWIEGLRLGEKLIARGIGKRGTDDPL